MAKVRGVERPRKKSEFEIVFATREAEKGWRDLCATIRGTLGVVTREGATYDRWQHKPTSGGDARIWFYVDDGVVHLEKVHTHHPNATK